MSELSLIPNTPPKPQVPDNDILSLEQQAAIDKEALRSLADISNIRNQILTPQQIQEAEKNAQAFREANRSQQQVVVPPVQTAPAPTGLPATTHISATVISQPNLGLNEQELLQAASLIDDVGSFIKTATKLESDDGLIDKFPTGIDLLDAVLGGGLGVGTFSVLVGMPGTFKSALVGQIIGASQKKYRGNMIATYLDSEQAMTTQRLAQLGAKYPRLKPFTDITVESVFKILESVCIYKETKNIIGVPSIVAWDSIANTCTDKDKVSEDMNSTMGLKARLLSYLFPKFVPRMREYRTSLIAINQLRSTINIGPYTKAADLSGLGDNDMPGGKAVKFNAFHLLYLKHKGDLKEDQYGFKGCRIEISCIKNKFFPSKIPVTVLVDFNSGLSNFWTNYEHLVDTKRIDSKAWQTFTARPDLKWRTKDAPEYYRDNTNGFKDIFDAQSAEAINTEIINKYKYEET